MAKLTREQFNKWNAQAQNGFTFDIQEFCVWNEKTLKKNHKLESGDVVEFRIEYDEEYETKTNEWGCRWNVKTGRYIPMLYIRIWHPSSTSGCYTSNGIYYERYELGEPENTKKYNVLCKLSAEVNTDEYMKKIIAA